MSIVKKLFMIGLASICLSAKAANLVPEEELIACVSMCDQALTNADRQIGALKREISAREQLTVEQDKQIDLLKVKIVEKEDALSSWYRDPVKTILLGAVIGAILGSR